MAPCDDIKCAAVPPYPALHLRDSGTRRYVPEEYTDQELRVSEAYPHLRVCSRHQLVSALSIQFDDEGIYRIPTGQFGPPDGPRDILITGDGLYGPDELYVTPEVQAVSPNDEIYVTVSCMQCAPFVLVSRDGHCSFFFCHDTETGSRRTQWRAGLRLWALIDL